MSAGLCPLKRTLLENEVKNTGLFYGTPWEVYFSCLCVYVFLLQDYVLSEIHYRLLFLNDPAVDDPV